MSDLTSDLGPPCALKQTYIEVDQRFNLRADWGAVDCQVLAVEPNKTLSYTWAAYGLESVVTWTLTPTSTGTHLRMEQSGFRPDQQRAY
jgi:uncharacterized protein YndB with AHSA1/START domain